MRIAWAIVALVAMAGVTLWLLQPTSDAGVATHPVTIIGPDGVIYNGTVTAQSTPLAVLLAAADDGGFDVEWQGDGTSAFVTRIDGHANAGAGGWCYEVLGVEGWTQPSKGAGAFRLPSGGPVRWIYAVDGCTSLS